MQRPANARAPSGATVGVHEEEEFSASKKRRRLGERDRTCQEIDDFNDHMGQLYDTNKQKLELQKQSSTSNRSARSAHAQVQGPASLVRATADLVEMMKQYNLANENLKRAQERGFQDAVELGQRVVNFIDEALRCLLGQTEDMIAKERNKQSR